MIKPTDVTDMKRTYRTAGEGITDTIHAVFTPTDAVRYGENPNQAAGMYRRPSVGDLITTKIVKDGKGGLSTNNWLDFHHALHFLKYFEKPAVAVMKHVIPSGFATGDRSTDELYADARDADARSAFGSVVVLNRPVDKATAEEIMRSYVEVVAAPSFEDGAEEVLGRKKDIRVVEYGGLHKLPKYEADGDHTRDDLKGLRDIRVLPTGAVVIQDPYLTSIRGSDSLAVRPLVRKGGVEYVVEREPTQEEMRDLLTSWYVNIGTRSNGILFVKDGVTSAVGSGQQERIGAVEQSILKAFQKEVDRKRLAAFEGDKDKFTDWASVLGGIEPLRDELGYNPLEGAVVSSDGFFPFRDSIDLLAEYGVSAIIQPGGSRKDWEIIEAANEHGIAMPFTLERCFGHF